MKKNTVLAAVCITIVVAVLLAALIHIRVPPASIPTHDFPVYVTGLFKHDEDGKWRCYANVTFSNDLNQSVTIKSCGFTLVNITYVDETSELLGIEGNDTTSRVVPSGSQLVWPWRLTEFGFSNEPKSLWFETRMLTAEYGTEIVNGMVSK